MTETPLISRLDYMNKKASHEQYYAQFVTPGVLNRIKNAFSRKDLEAGKDDHFNNIPLQYWNELMPVVPYEIVNKLNACGDSPTLAGVVCILKEGARQLVSKPQTKH
jgi:hypothetical protein